MKFVNLVITETNPRTADSVRVKSYYSDEFGSPLQRIRAAVEDFVKSKTEDSIDALNWGDAMVSVPEKYYVKYGLIPIDVINVFVRHNGDLSEGYEEEEEEDEDED